MNWFDSLPEVYKWAFQGIGVAIAAGLLRGLWVFNKWRKRQLSAPAPYPRMLCYYIRSLRLFEDCHARVQLRFGDQNFRKLDSHLVWLTNGGTEALRDLQIVLTSGDGRIVEHEVGGPAGARYEARVDGGVLVLLCELLNPGDSLCAALTVADARPDLAVVAHHENLKVEKAWPPNILWPRTFDSWVSRMRHVELTRMGRQPLLDRVPRDSPEWATVARRASLIAPD